MYVDKVKASNRDKGLHRLSGQNNMWLVVAILYYFGPQGRRGGNGDGGDY